MTYGTRIALRCDWPSCLVKVETGAAKVGDARARARQAGWAQIDGLDLCGPPSADDLERRDRWQQLTGVRESIPDDHAEQYRAGAHRPDLEKSSSGSVRARCSCGWRPEQPLWSNRVRAVRKWRWRHFNELVRAESATREEQG